LFSQQITVIKGVQQGCPFSLTLFNIYIYVHINQIITEWKEEKIKGIKISCKDITTVLSADVQVIVVDSEDALQISAHKLETVIPPNTD
jgi:hypothetical protein